jgi:Fe-S cluster biogenesis protein NfuA/nitrite reductase/ring-hydroxylating ferredoxin subunit
MAATQTQTEEAAAPDVLMERVQRLSAEVDRISDPGAREAAQELLAAVMDLYGEGLVRVLAATEDAGEAGESIRRRLSEDGVVASLMLIHDLYPVPLETRVREALEGVRPYMESHGGNVTLLGLEGGVARLRLEGSCDGCPASASTLELAIKQALDEAAPDLAGLEVEGVAEGSPGGLRAEEAMTGTPLPVVHVAADSPNGNGAAAPEAPPPIGSGRWLDLAAGLMPADGQIATTSGGEMSILIANVGGSLLAFRDRCASCDSELAAGELDGGVLACPECERRFYLPRAGRSMDDEALLLEPVPLLAQDGSVRIAVSA